MRPVVPAQRPPRLADMLLAAGVALAQLLLVGIAAGSPSAGAPWRAPSLVTVALVLAQALPLALRRRFPVPVFGAALAGNVAYYLIGYPPTGLDVALVVALYTVAAHRAARVATPVFVVSVMAVVVPAFGGWGPFWSRATAALVAYLVVFFAAGYAAGRYQRVRRLYNQEQLRLLQALAEQAQRERAAAAARAVKAERSRLARELHDSVAHHLSVVAVQAAVAVRQLDRDRVAARRALDAVQEASREGLATMPAIVRALRGSEREPSADGPADAADGGWSRVETLADLPATVERLRRAGCPVELRMITVPDRLPPGVSESAFRVAQEALTNAVKHAPGASVVVTVGGGHGEVDVEVTDDGPRGHGGAPAAGGGHGLLGMRERVSLFGGTFSAGPRPGGGFAVHARFPVTVRPPERAAS